MCVSVCVWGGGGSEVKPHAFLALTLDEVRDRLYISAALPGEYGHLYTLIRRQMSPIAGLD